ncbi:hypothetical protein PMG11_10107 [Penicillium brasilianum]|uniref:MACPF domain-containing protein n=1 Tax=Penicillium brasilianum TaxID=104259 RepID=A0A0F7U2M4_PENBI|nr:hypothetical protein PMG11_10107 [Penicillium brasilianum]
MKHARVDVAKLGLQNADIRALAAGPIVQFLHAGELDEREWETVLRNSSVMHGWYVDMQTKKIKQAPKPAFRLLPGLNMPAELTALPPLLGEKMRTTKPLLPGVDPQSTGYGEPAAATGEEEPQGSGETPGAPGEGQDEDEEQDAEDKETQPTGDSGVSTNLMMSNESLLIPERDSDRQTVDDDENSNHSLESAPEPVSASQPTPPSGSASETAPASVNAYPPPRDNKAERLPSFPSFTVNDNSKIEFTVAHHEIHVSMAKNNFSMNGFEAAASGSFFGVSARASGGFTEEKATGSGSANDNKERTMIAGYNFPRATLYLRPEDLEITPELRDAIAKLSELRKLHEMFGHLFCHEVILGGSLQTTRTTTSSDQQTWTTEKEKFKAEVGASLGYMALSSA